MSQIYVYYKVDATHRAAALAAAAHVLDMIEASCGLRGALSCRSDDPMTLMETYVGVTDPTVLKTQLDAAAIASGLNDLILGHRHTEHFVSCA